MGKTALAINIAEHVALNEGLPVAVFSMTFHFADDVDVNLLTIEANDPRSGTAEFKAAAVRVDKLPSV